MIKNILSGITIACLAVNCSDHSLTGGGNGGADKTPNHAYARQNGAQDQSTSDGPEANFSVFDPETVFGNSPDEIALKSCFKEWGATPFTAEQAKRFKTLNTSSVGFGNSNVSDRAKTRQPVLILVRASAVGFGNLKFDLGNPNGWYCFSASTVGFSNLDVMKHCKATLGNFRHDSTGFGDSNTMEYGEDC